MIAGEIVVVHRKDDDVFEIEVAGLEDPHDLDALQRLALEGDAQRLQVPAQQRGVDLGRKVDIALVERVAQLGDLLGDDRQEFDPLPCIVALVGLARHGGDHVQHVVGQLAPRRGGRKDPFQQFVAAQPRGIDRNAAVADDLLVHRARECGVALGHIGVCEDAGDVGMVERAAVALAAAVVLQLHQTLDERVGQALPQGEAHRHVHPSDVGGQGVQQRQQQVLVGKHHGGLLAQRGPGARGDAGVFLPAAAGQVGEDRRGILALHGVRDGGDRHDLLLPPHVVVPKFRAGRELRHVRTHEHTRLLFGVVLIIRVVVPVKIGFGRRGEEPEKALLALGKGVEPRHDITPGLGEDEPAPADAVGGGALHHAVVGDAERRETLPEAAVDGAEGLPDRQKTAFLLRKVGLLAERGPERKDAQLRGREVGNIGFDLLDLRDVAEQHLRVDQVFVDRIEVREEHVAPEIELVERFVVVGRVDFVELGDEPHAVARMQPRYFARQVVDRHPFGLPHRTPGDTPQGIDEKQPRTPRREEHRPFGQSLAIARIQVGGHLLQKSLHSSSDSPGDFPGGIVRPGSGSSLRIIVP